jgi:hypothetical protein
LIPELAAASSASPHFFPDEILMDGAAGKFMSAR